MLHTNLLLLCHNAYPVVKLLRYLAWRATYVCDELFLCADSDILYIVYVVHVSRDYNVFKVGFLSV